LIAAAPLIQNTIINTLTNLTTPTRSAKQTQKSKEGITCESKVGSWQQRGCASETGALKIAFNLLNEKKK